MNLKLSKQQAAKLQDRVPQNWMEDWPMSKSKDRPPFRLSKSEDRALGLRAKERAAFLRPREISEAELRDICMTATDPADIRALIDELTRRHRFILREGRSPNVLPLRRK